MQQYLEAGKVVTTHGVRGEMKLELWCDGVDFLKKAGRLFPSAQGGRAYKITSIRPQGQMALLQLEGVNDMDAARALRGQVFYFDRNDATLPAGRWYVADLIGCEVRDADTGKVYGVVTSVDHPGAQDIYTVKSPSGKEYTWHPMWVACRSYPCKRPAMSLPMPLLYSHHVPGATTFGCIPEGFEFQESLILQVSSFIKDDKRARKATSATSS